MPTQKYRERHKVVSVKLDADDQKRLNDIMALARKANPSITVNAAIKKMISDLHGSLSRVGLLPIISDLTAIDPVRRNGHDEKLPVEQ